MIYILMKKFKELNKIEVFIFFIKNVKDINKVTIFEKYNFDY